MHVRESLHRVLFGREVTAAFAILAALYPIRRINFQPFQIPAYLLIVTYDLIETILPMVDPYYPIAFPLYLYLLALTGGVFARNLRMGTSEPGTLRRAAGGVSLVVGLIAVLFAIVVGGPLVAPSENPTPLAITGTTGVIFLITAWWLLRRLPRRSQATT